MSFLKQFTGRPFWWMVGGLVLLDIVSFLVLHTPAEIVLFFLIVIGSVVLAIRAPQWLFPIAIAEIISTSNGHSLGVELFGAPIGLRIALFAVLMVTSFVHLVRERHNPVPKSYRLLSLLFVMVLLYGLVQGLLLDHPLRSLYLDANGYLAIGYIFAAWVWTRTAIDRHRLLQAVGAGITWISVKTLLFLFLFGHLHPKTLEPLYLWIRDTRLGEITLQRANVFRIFLQSQWFTILGVLGAGSYMVFAEKERDSTVRVLFIIIYAALLISLSRSFWVAIIAASIVFCIYALVHNWRNLLSRIPDFVVLKVTAVALLWVIVAVPIFQTVGSDIFGSLLRDRATQTTEAALDSRRQLLDPMLNALSQSPIAGYGLGKELTYETSDPRWIDSHDTNIVSTYAFEWGWLDIWVKFGIVGIFLFAFLFYQLVRDLVRAIRTDSARCWLYVTLLMALIALYVTHMFTPYLNHPLGWGMIAIVVALLPRQTRIREVEERSSMPKKMQPAIIISRHNL